MAASVSKLPLVQAHPDFQSALRRNGFGQLRRSRITTLQVNVGKLCNMACQHCHVEAGPKRTEIMSRIVADRVLELIRTNECLELIDLTGGAPELNPNFRRLVSEARRLGRGVVDRCNLSVLHEAGQEDLAEFLAVQGVQIVASLPCYSQENVEQQRGKGAFDSSIRALRRLNALGYGRPDSGLKLDLVYNPTGAFLPPAQRSLQDQYRRELADRFGIVFNELLTITNMPISRFAHWLRRTGREQQYMGLLVDHFNPTTVAGLMCRSLISVGWDGRLYDCDFNQMLELPLGGQPRTVWDVDDLNALTGQGVATASHCFGCTAGAGSSCGGALTD